MSNKTWAIDTTHEYLITSSDRSQYQFLASSGFQECTKYGSKLVCWGPHHWNTGNSAQCEWNLFNQLSNKNFSVQPSPHEYVWFDIGENRWPFYTKLRRELSFICDDRAFHDEIIGSGTVYIEQNCTFKGVEMELIGRKTFQGIKGRC